MYHTIEPGSTGFFSIIVTILTRRALGLAFGSGARCRTPTCSPDRRIADRNVALVPYAAIALTAGAERLITASPGFETAAAERSPLIRSSVRIGEVIAAPRDGGVCGATDRRLIAATARQTRWMSLLAL